MGISGQRYEAIQDPCGHWIVWDKTTEQPAVLAKLPLFALRQEEAVSMAALLNLAGDEEPAVAVDALLRAS